MNDEILMLAKKTFDNYQLCDSCLGRLFRQVKKGPSNKQKGELIRTHLKLKQKINPENCWLCEGITEEIEHFAKLISDEFKEYEFDTFLIGSKIDEDIVENEKELWSFIGSEDFEPIKMEINREVGKILEKKLGKTVDFEKPDITAIVDTAFDDVNLQIQSLFIYGKYKKFERGMEELIAKKALELTKSNDESFHGCGREDIDALMLGGGRPFVLEIKNPKKRNIDLTHLNSEINAYTKDKVEISDLRFSDRKEIARIKSAKFQKTYRIKIEGEKPIKKEKLKEVAQLLQGKTIKQLTPTRVAHRRANKVREKKIYNCILESVEGTIAILTIETESGTYVKELISGDSGRTTPNISEMIGIPCKVKELDVIEIKGE